MRIVDLTLQNFKVYYGKQKLYFGRSNEANSNIILIGGLNGSGKTSILTAIELLLFGKGILDANTYKKKLNGAINNRYFNEGGTTSELSMTIEDNGIIYRIFLKIFFDKSQNFTVEERYMKASNNVSKFNEYDIRRFVDKNIPQEVSSFFIFDGEKIQDLVEKQEERGLKNAIQKIISIDFFNNVIEDIILAEKKLQREYNKQVNSSTLNKLGEEKNKIEDEINIIVEKLRNFEVMSENFNQRRLEVKKIRDEKIKRNSNTKDKIVREISTIENKISMIENYLVDYAQKHLPILILMPIIEEVQKRIKIEYEYQFKTQQVKLNFKQFDEFITKLFYEIEILNLSDEQISIIYNNGKKVWADFNQITNTVEPEKLEILHDLSQNDKRTIELINKSSMQLDIKGLTTKKQALEEKLNKLKNDFSVAPEAVDYSAENRELDEIQAKLVEISLRMRSLTTKKIRLSSEFERVNKKYKEQLKQVKLNSQLEKQVDLVSRVVDASKKFVESVTLYKAKCIKEDFEDIITKLLRKTNDFSKIEFDLTSYSIKIYNQTGTPVRLVDRSAGEKQIIALCLIWALTKNAGRDLPYIIDTPLGRLDSVHRRNLIEHYFPNLSKQVIILSTDTEVNKEFNDEILKNVHISYRLDYDGEKNYSNINEGYFNF